MKELVNVLSLLEIMQAKAQTGFEMTDEAYEVGGYYFDLTAFYSQPFKPESIPLLFEGLHQFKYANHHYYAYNENPTEWIEHEGSTVIVICKDGGRKYCLAEILADFITDCKRAGLSLYWRKEVVEEYPFLNI